MDLSLVFRHGDGVLLSVFALLLAMSITSWWLILRRGLTLWSTRRANQQLAQAFWDAADLGSAASLAQGSRVRIEMSDGSVGATVNND